MLSTQKEMKLEILLLNFLNKQGFVLNFYLNKITAHLQFLNRYLGN